MIWKPKGLLSAANATKGPRVSKSLSYHWSRSQTGLEFKHGNHFSSIFMFWPIVMVTMGQNMNYCMWDDFGVGKNW